MGLTVVTSGGASTIVTRHPVSGTIVTREPLAALAVVTRQIAAISGVVAPTVQATDIIFSSVLDVSMVINFTDGDGSSRIVVARSGAAVSDLPADLTSYTANNAFGSGDAIGTGFVVASGSGPFTITGLTAGTYYHYRVFEFNGSGGTENYFTDTATGNPRNYAPWNYLVEAGLKASYATDGTDGFFTIDEGNLISRWNPENDDGGARYLEQLTGTQQPLLSSFIPVFDSNDDNFTLQPGAIGLTNYTIIFITDVNLVNTRHYANKVDNTDALRVPPEGYMRSRISSANRDTANGLTTGEFMLSFSRSGSTIYHQKNTAVRISGGLNSATFDLEIIGRGSLTIPGNLKHILIYNAWKSGTAHNAILNELNTRYSIF